MQKNNNKTVLIFHGFPGMSPGNPVIKYFSGRGFRILIPQLFDSQGFNMDVIRDKVDRLLQNKEPEIIAGISLGGLIAPHFAARYPRAKLILIATGPRVKVGIKTYEILLKKGSPRMVNRLFRTAQKAPAGVYRTFYKFFNPAAKTMESYETNIRDSYNMFKSCPGTIANDLVSFARTTDNSDLLPKLKNKTVIISGDGDRLMPAHLSLELLNLMPESKLVYNTNRLHYNIFDEGSFGKLDEFLNK